MLMSIIGWQEYRRCGTFRFHEKNYKRHNSRTKRNFRRQIIKNLPGILIAVVLVYIPCGKLRLVMVNASIVSFTTRHMATGAIQPARGVACLSADQVVFDTSCAGGLLVSWRGLVSIVADTLLLVGCVGVWVSLLYLGDVYHLLETEGGVKEWWPMCGDGY